MLGVLISMIYVSTFLSQVLIFPGSMFDGPCTIVKSLLLIVCGSLEQSTVLQYENSDKGRGLRMKLRIFSQMNLFITDQQYKY